MPAKPAWPPRSAPRLFVEQELERGARITIEGNQAHYLGRVMRVAEGDTVVVCDNRTGEWVMRVAQVTRHAVSGLVTEMLRPRERVPDFVLCAALLKKDRFDLVLEKATELGVRRVQPVLARRCVADRLNVERARAVMIEAAEQCARTALPELAEPAKLDTLLRDWPEERTLFFADERGGDPALTAFVSHGGAAALLIGPEGGFDDGEREAVRALPQAHPISLGPRILRGETAALAASALWMAAVGDW
ncbi:MAG TPA: 16S rRNA (uracil(1498)-N(3))-methyltransferase [Croceibacterium sp.]|nr:16S rRNA (uracil(1498)-N(3))-methyltransferase [Croceibacterium sp.]